MEEIRDGERLMAIIWRSSDWTPGLNFCTPDHLFIQAGCWQYPAGTELAAHRHKIYERKVAQTQEVVYVKRGGMKVRIFDDDKRLIKEVVLRAGDFAVLADCAHGYEILEDDTQVLEVKNGPFIDVGTDKEPL
ncbi:MAG: hypothetical protein V3U93_09505 [Alphaproteobacteria bacterium]